MPDERLPRAESPLSRAVTVVALTVVGAAAIVMLTAAALAPADVARFGFPALASVGVAGFGYLARHHVAQAVACVLVAGLVGTVAAVVLAIPSRTF